MPCNSIQRSSVEFKLEGTSLDLMRLAMEKLGFRAQEGFVFVNSNGSKVEFKNGTMVKSMRYGTDLEVNQVKRAYSTEVVKHTAKKFGWKLTEKATGKFQVQRGF